MSGSPRRLGLPGLAALALALGLPPSARGANDAVCVSQTVPASVPRDATFEVELQFQNTGDTAWTRDGGYIMGSESPRDNVTWGTNRVWLDPDVSVAPGETAVLRGTLTAPALEGEYDFQWQMLQDAVEWFGAPSPALRIQVTAPQLACDGSEVLCLALTSQAEVEASGGWVVGGDFGPQGFQPSNQGGIDWQFGPERDFSAGELRLTVTGLQPLPGGEQEGGKVSLFALCGLAPQDNEDIGLQKMDETYRDGHIFRYGMDDDGLADNWDAVIITGRDFGCYYSINDPPWQAGESHELRLIWSRDGLELWIDAAHCSSAGNGDTFDPIDAVFSLANRCQHYANQQAIARFSMLRLWARGTQAADCGNGQLDPGETCDGDCPTACDDGQACTQDTLQGSAASCDAACSFQPVAACQAGDGCCPAGCGPADDPDCAPGCGNGQIDSGETCDGDCPTACDDGQACTQDTLQGSAASCDAACSFQPVAACQAGDGCCPAGCGPANDSDCPVTCGNGRLDPGETCDGDCPTACDDGQACTLDQLVGNPAGCTAACSASPIALCQPGDGCCPAGCTRALDRDCPEEGEAPQGGCGCGLSRTGPGATGLACLVVAGLGLLGRRRFRRLA